MRIVVMYPITPKGFLWAGRRRHKLVDMLKTGVLATLVALSACASPADDIGPDAGQVDVLPYLGDWSFEFDATACDWPGTYRTTFRIELVGDEPEVTLWTLHANYNDEVEAFSDSLSVVLDVTSGPSELFDMVLVSEPPQVAFRYETQNGTEPCTITGVGANVTFE